MSPALPSRFRGTLIVGRCLSREFDARDAQAAEDIATWLYATLGSRHFDADAETVHDCIVDPIGEASA